MVKGFPFLCPPPFCRHIMRMIKLDLELRIPRQDFGRTHEIVHRKMCHLVDELPFPAFCRLDCLLFSLFYKFRSGLWKVAKLFSLQYSNSYYMLMKNYGVSNSNMLCYILFCSDVKSYVHVIDLNVQVSSFRIAFVITHRILLQDNTTANIASFSPFIIV